jgi:hypothetical protein
MGQRYLGARLELTVIVGSKVGGSVRLGRLVLGKAAS